MEIKLTANINGTSKSVIVPIQKVVDAFWPKGETPPFALTVSTVLGKTVPTPSLLSMTKPKSPIPVFGLRQKTSRVTAIALGSAWSCRMKPTAW
jgi:hypothetical protein